MQSVGDPSRCAAGAVQLSPRPFVPQQRGAARKADLLKLLFSSAADEGEVWERVPSLRETAGRGGGGGAAPSSSSSSSSSSLPSLGAVVPGPKAWGCAIPDSRTWLVPSRAVPNAV